LNLKVTSLPDKQCDLLPFSPTAVIGEGWVWQGRVSIETLPVMLSHLTPLHSQQSDFGNHEERSCEGSVSRCLKLRSTFVSFSLQWTAKLHELNMMEHSEQRKNNLMMEMEEFMIMQFKMWVAC